jgi:hypothetical protein
MIPLRIQNSKSMGRYETVVSTPQITTQITNDATSQLPPHNSHLSIDQIKASKNDRRSGKAIAVLRQTHQTA